MDWFTRDELQRLRSKPHPPCVSIFLATHRVADGSDPIRFRKALTEAENRLTAEGYKADVVRDTLAAGWRLIDDEEFWKHQGDGLACYLSPTVEKFYRLPLALADDIVVGASFAITPVLPMLTGDGSFYILALSQKSVRLLQATRHTVCEMSVRGLPKSIAEALATHDRDEPLRFHPRPTPGGGWGAIFSGQGVGIDDKKDDLLRYFQAIDRALHPVLAAEKRPLVLAAVDYFHPIYRVANSYAGLRDHGVTGNPDRLSGAELHQRAWSVVQPIFDKDRQSAADRYHQAFANGYASGDLETVVTAAHNGLVDILFVAEGKAAWGIYFPFDGRIEPREGPEAGACNLIELAVERVLDHGGSVFVVPPDDVPGQLGVASVLRRPVASLAGRV